MPLGPPLRQTFYARDSRLVAADLIGCRIVHRLRGGHRLVLRIVEVEAYRGDGSDAASHSHRGETPRNHTLFGPAGRLYAYRSYGIHICINVVCGERGAASAVLLRAAEPLEGLARMRRLRCLPRRAQDREIARGPGRLAAALGLPLDSDGSSLLSAPLTLHLPDASRPTALVERGPRVGITKATELLDRFFEKDCPWVSAFRKGRKKTEKPRPNSLDR